MEKISSKKRVKVSKKNKKAWRKHSNVKDIEEHFVERQEELRSGGIIAEKPDTSLFFVDREKSNKKSGPRTKEEWKEKSLRCYQYITPDPNIPVAPKGQARGKKTKPITKTPLQILKEKEAKKKPNRAKDLKHASKQRRAAAEEIIQREEAEVHPLVTYDLWTQGPQEEKLSKKLIGADDHFLRSTKRARVKVPTRYKKKPSSIDAVEIPDPGTSYNPSYEDHQTLLKKMYNAEKKDLKKEKTVENWFDYEKISPKKLEERYISEMSAGLFDDNEEDVDAQNKKNEEDTAAVLPNPPAIAEARKTKRQRRIEKQQREAERLRKEEKLSKTRMNDVYRLRGLKREIEKEETCRAKRRKRKLERSKAEDGQTKKLGKYHFEPVPDAFKLTSQLPESLRSLKPEGNVIQDRYRHFTKRNMLEGRMQKRNPKAALKEYEKRGHKEVTA